ncbi:5-deoxy-glucuronate isomerase [Roseibaca sp. V10]|uniref:5-deoxy-glucuronate isomerase n=1 Tax=Roseinatronobacter domitianus TaxID=2940293 RepID=A0ABT0M478_9RHOB|nr:5-deoxy-glucuronate isomerase [Roseibaca domitiana]MCL1629671.1 5-deoxy-glucuronate isomerase [Roseibaca domitiana]
MAGLLRKPTAKTGHIHAITPQDAGWHFVGFDLWRLAPGEVATGQLEGREAILVLVEGHAEITADGESLGEMGGRLNVFERNAPHCVYVPPATPWQARATTQTTLAVCTAPSPGGRPVQVLGPDGISLEVRGSGSNTRYINNIAMEGRDVADSLLVTEVFTPAGHWSSYPPHRHDEDDYPNLTYLEETYYHRLNPSDCFGLQRVFTDDLSLDETMAPADHDVVLVPRGHHPCAAPHGVEMYYLNVMAGPRRAWRFRTHPAFEHMTR